MKFLRVIILGLCLVGCTRDYTDRYNLDKAFKASRIAPGDKVERDPEESSEKDPEEPNGLDNNGRRCYANAASQVLAAYFREEIKNLPEYSDERKKQLRASLLTIVDHINNKRKRNTGDKEVLEAVKNLTKLLGTQDERGGSSSDFLNLLGKELGFLPVYETVRYEYKFLGSLTRNGISHDMNMEPFEKSCKKASMFSSDMIFIPEVRNFSVIDGRKNGEMPLKMKTVITPEELFAVEIEKRLQNFFQELCIDQSLDNLISVSCDNLCQSVFDHLSDENEEGSKVSCNVVFESFKDRLPAGSKLLVDASNRHKISTVISYGERPLHLQKLDLVGFIVNPGWEHAVAYIKREGTWYEADDGSIRRVGEKDIDEVLDKCSKSFGGDPSGGIGYGYAQSISVYEARN